MYLLPPAVAKKPKPPIAKKPPIAQKPPHLVRSPSSLDDKENSVSTSPRVPPPLPRTPPKGPGRISNHISPNSTLLISKSPAENCVDDSSVKTTQTLKQKTPPVPPKKSINKNSNLSCIHGKDDASSQSQQSFTTTGSESVSITPFNRSVTQQPPTPPKRNLNNNQVTENAETKSDILRNSSVQKVEKVKNEPVVNGEIQNECNSINDDVRVEEKHLKEPDLKCSGEGHTNEETSENEHYKGPQRFNPFNKETSVEGQSENDCENTASCEEDLKKMQNHGGNSSYDVNSENVVLDVQKQEKHLWNKKDKTRSLGSPEQDELTSSDSDGEDDEEKLKKKKEKKVFFIANEIVSSEKVFVDVLKLLNQDFRLHISQTTESLQRIVISNDILNKILNYLPQLQNFNEDLLHDLEERISHWEEHKKVADIFVKKGPFLKLYTSYIKDFEEMTLTLDEACKKNPAFHSAASPRCANLGLKHYMLKPIQRIPQYKLLLKDYRKHLSPSSPDYEDTNSALNIVSEVADHANESMRHGDQVHKLLEIQRSLDGNFEVIKPGRILMKQGELMKLSRKEMQPRFFFLFNDVLLYTTPMATGGYRLNNALTLAGMKATKANLDEFKNEFNIISVQRSFTVEASINQFVHIIQIITSYLDKDFVLGSKAPIWVPDTRVTMCMNCTGEFTVTWRRHHCRACGRVVCANCSDNRAPLEYLRNKPARVCDDCFEKLHEDFEKKAGGSSVEVVPDNIDQDGSLLSFSSLKERFQKIRRSTRLGHKFSVHRPSRLREVHASDQGSSMSGNLKMLKGRKWKKFWFVIKDKVLYTYKASADMAAIESMPILGYEVVRFTEPFEGVAPALLFQLNHKNRPPVIFQTDNTNSTERWVKAMKDASVA
ncbi:hypothetical protein KUTeg_020814 [Tegillarca granosa]|uniref:FYVE, RhoGEF and PH domain-containing protein 6 n=1 Tax=Tegillarca granosa TaxID=220873 RepID=A0ABQ9EE61_TEGGR|nr:hypothetical protein KUTeg_020814 [Tegillarca granosa]